MEKDLEKQFDSYIKKTIINTVITFAKQENTKRHREVSFEDSNEVEVPVPFSFETHSELEDYVENEKLYNAITSLSSEQKQVMKLKIIDNHTSKEISCLLNKSDSRIRHIYSDAIKQLQTMMRGEKND